MSVSVFLFCRASPLYSTARRSSSRPLCLAMTKFQPELQEPECGWLHILQKTPGLRNGTMCWNFTGCWSETWVGEFADKYLYEPCSFCETNKNAEWIVWCWGWKCLICVKPEKAAPECATIRAEKCFQWRDVNGFKLKVLMAWNEQWCANVAFVTLTYDLENVWIYIYL